MPGRPAKPRVVCDEHSLTDLLRDLEMLPRELEEWLAVYKPGEPGTSAAVLLTLRREMNTLGRKAEALWRDAHARDIEAADAAAADPPGRDRAEAFNKAVGRSTPAPPNHLHFLRGGKE
jgi:hypothetical protein